MAKQAKDIFHISGKPMSFYVPAGVKKGELVELITKHGGKVVRDEKAADVVLWEKTFHNDSGNQVISKNFVYDSVKSGKLQDSLSYAIKQTPKKAKTPKKGRTGFTSTDDRILLDLVSKNPEFARGNRIYKELEAKNRRHTWQSWRDRYIKFLAPNQRKTLGPSGSSDSSNKPAFKKRRLSRPESESDSENGQPLTQALDYQDVVEEGEEEDVANEEEEEEQQQGVSDEEDEISIKIKSENDTYISESDSKKASQPLETKSSSTLRVSMTGSYIIDDSDEDNLEQSVMYEEVTENTHSLEADAHMIDEMNTSDVMSGREGNESESSQEESIPPFESYEEITQQTQEDIDEEFDSPMISESQLQTQVTENHESDLDSQPLQSSSNLTTAQKSPIKEHGEAHSMEIELQIEDDDVEMESHDEGGWVESQDAQPLTQKFNDTLDESVEDLSQDQSQDLATGHGSEVDDDGDGDGDGEEEEEEEEMDDVASDRLTQLEQAQQDLETLDAEPNEQRGTENEQHQEQSFMNMTDTISENPQVVNDPTTDRNSLREKIQQERQQLRAASTPITRNRSQTPISHQQRKSGTVSRARSNTPALANHSGLKGMIFKADGKPPALPQQPNASEKINRANSQTPVLPHHELDKNQDSSFLKYRTLYLRMIKGLCITTKATPEEVVKAIKMTSGNFTDAEQILLHGEKECSNICWTAIEDQILLDGDNSDVIQELLNKKGHERTHLRNQFLNFYSEPL